VKSAQCLILKGENFLPQDKLNELKIRNKCGICIKA